MFIKIRHSQDEINKRILSLPVERRLIVDERMVPYKEHLQIKQYVNGKPYPWGIRVFLLCGKSGLQHTALTRDYH